jgi:hypothetical protein
VTVSISDTQHKLPRRASFYHYAEYHFEKCRYVKYHYAECRNTEYHYAECHYAECYYAECRGTVTASFYGSFAQGIPVGNVALDPMSWHQLV